MTFNFCVPDLVPKEILSKWLQHLRQRVPAIAFKASTQKQKQNLARRKVKKNWSEKETNISPCVGAEVLMSLLNNYCRNKGIKTAIHVGIVGECLYPYACNLLSRLILALNICLVCFLLCMSLWINASFIPIIYFNPNVIVV